MRPTKSDAPPGANGTIMRTGRVGIEPGVGLLAHWTAQLAKRYIADGIARQKIHMAPFVGRITLALHEVGGKHHVAVGVVDREHAFGPDRADFEAVDSTRPNLG